MLNGTPCVILEGSGRIADVIANVAGLPVTRVTISLISQLLKKFFGQEYENFADLKIKWTKQVAEHTEPPQLMLDIKFDVKPCTLLFCFLCQIQDIIRMSHLLTVFRVSEDHQGDVDVAILRALFKGGDMVSTQMLNN